MAPGQKKPTPGPQQNGQKKKGYNPYNKFKNRHWKKKKNPDENNASKPNDGAQSSNRSHPTISSPMKVVQTPISNL